MDLQGSVQWRNSGVDLPDYIKFQILWALIGGFERLQNSSGSNDFCNRNRDRLGVVEDRTGHGRSYIFSEMESEALSSGKTVSMAVLHNDCKQRRG